MVEADAQFGRSVNIGGGGEVENQWLFKQRREHSDERGVWMGKKKFQYQQSGNGSVSGGI